jgi:hypothetical protein
MPHYPPWPQARPYIERELAEIRETLPEALRAERDGEVPHHHKGDRLYWLYTRMSYLLELLGEWAPATAALDEGAHALESTPRKPGADWTRSRERIRGKLNGGPER